MTTLTIGPQGAAITIGTCSLCGGAVVVLQVQTVGEDNTPWCTSCGAKKKEPTHGPIIEMCGGWKK